MEVTEKQIISLICQDLRHEQLVHVLRSSKFDDGGLYDLEIMEVVAELMGLPKNSNTDEHLWYEAYIRFLEKAHEYGVTPLGESLKPLAEQCYKVLIDYADIEIQMRSKI